MYCCGFIHTIMDRSGIYPFQPLICIKEVMQRMWKDKTVGILEPLDCSNQIWYCQLSQLSKEVFLSLRSDLLALPTRSTKEHPLNKTPHLRAALVSGQ